MKDYFAEEQEHFLDILRNQLKLDNQYETTTAVKSLIVLTTDYF
jgi:hypothetical protein